MNKFVYAILFALIFLMLNGCATLEVTPSYQTKITEVALPKTVVIKAAGERLLDSFNDTAESKINAVSGKLFNKVVLLPEEMFLRSNTEIKSTYNADYILSVQINDINVNGDLNPIWFASIPLFFFKQIAPIVTFDATATVDFTAIDAISGVNILQKQISVNSIDHFSPINPQNKVKKLISRSINSALVIFLEELNGKVGKKL